MPKFSPCVISITTPLLQFERHAEFFSDGNKFFGVLRSTEYPKTVEVTNATGFAAMHFALRYCVCPEETTLRRMREFREREFDSRSLPAGSSFGKLIQERKSFLDAAARDDASAYKDFAQKNLVDELHVKLVAWFVTHCNAVFAADPKTKKLRTCAGHVEFVLSDLNVLVTSAFAGGLTIAGVLAQYGDVGDTSAERAGQHVFERVREISRISTCKV